MGALELGAREGLGVMRWEMSEEKRLEEPEMSEFLERCVWSLRQRVQHFGETAYGRQCFLRQF